MMDKALARNSCGAARLFLVVTLAATTAAAGVENGTDPESRRSSRGRYLMGTRLTIECRDQVAGRLFDAAFDAVARLEAILSNWSEESELSRMNRDGGRVPFAVSGELLHAIEVSLEWAERTGGAFDPTVESLVRRFGLRDRTVLGDPAVTDADGPAENRIAGIAPSPTPAVGWRYVEVDHEHRAVRFARDGIGIDLGGIGKGIALDRAARVLRDGGVDAALLDFGGQVMAVGEDSTDADWLVGVADPARRGRVVATVTLRRGSLATSGNSERAVLGESGIVGHILDPQSGAPARFAGSVTVLADDGTSADALSTALFVMGPDRGIAWAENREIAALYVRRTDSGELEFLPTRFMRRGIDWRVVGNAGVARE